MSNIVTVYSIVLGVVALAAIVALFWLVITIIRALNVYIAKNRLQMARDELQMARDELTGD
ncbi:MAG: hypothetical protein H7146_11995 [Burkholderiaceae bacterium]|nr:hypothetical protein [Microbacteriaceae bacterium]